MKPCVHQIQSDDGGIIAERPPRLYPPDTEILNSGNAADWSRFTFEHVAGVEWYGIWIGTANYAYTALYQWFPATDSATGAQPDTGICDLNEGVCTIPQDLWMEDGSYAWWMTTWSPGETAADVDRNWNQTIFVVDFSPPTAFFPITPAQGETINTTITEMSWTRDPDVLWTHIWVGQVSGPNGTPYTVKYGWFDVTEICSGTTCTLPLDENPVVDGEYQVWVEVWGPDRYFNWIQMNSGNPAATFNVDTGGS